MPWLITYKNNGEQFTNTKAIKETPVEWIAKNYGYVSLIYTFQISDEEYTLLTAGK